MKIYLYMILVYLICDLFFCDLFVGSRGLIAWAVLRGLLVLGEGAGAVAAVVYV